MSSLKSPIADEGRQPLAGRQAQDKGGVGAQFAGDDVGD